MKSYRVRIPRALVVAVVCLSAAPGARAVPLHFDNPAPGEAGHADWLALVLLDITMPASQQVGLAKGFEVLGTFEFRIDESFDPFADPQGVVRGVVSGGFGGRIAVIPFLFQPGDLIGPGGVIPDGAGGDVFTDFFNDSTLVGSSLVGPLGEHFLGVRYALPGGVNWHYGYIGFNLLERADGTHGLFATSWGYETELDTDIVIIPAPGAPAMLLGAGVIGFATRRRRRPPA